MTEEYIKKDDMARIIYSTNNVVRIGELFTELPSYSFPDSAENKPEHEKLMNDIEENREKEVVIVQTENKGDLISRQAVINAIANTCFWLSADNWEELTKCISSIPSVENKGEWIYDKGIYNWRCSRCGQTPPPTGYVGKVDFMETHFKFCPNCGADMRESNPKLGNRMLVGKSSLLNQIPIGEKGE